MKKETTKRFFLSIITFEIRYHIPRSYLKPKDNLMVVLEEEAAHPEQIEILTVNRDTICSYMTEDHPPNVRSWARKDNKFRPVVDVVKPAAQLRCPNFKKIVAVDFASFGDPYGTCGGFSLGNCTSPVSKKVVEQASLTPDMSSFFFFFSFSNHINQ